MSPVHVWVVSQLKPYSCLLSMTRKDNRAVRHLCEHSQTLDYLKHAASLKIGAPDGTLKQGVTREKHVLLIAIKADRAARVARCGNNLEGVVAELYFIAVIEIMSYGRHFAVKFHIERLCLFAKVLHQPAVTSRDLRLKAVLVGNKAVAEIVVKVAVSDQQVYRLQSIAVNILFDGLALLFIIGAAVNDDTLLCGVAHDITVLLQHVAGKTFDIYHFAKF